MIPMGFLCDRYGRVKVVKYAQLLTMLTIIVSLRVSDWRNFAYTEFFRNFFGCGVFVGTISYSERKTQIFGVNCKWTDLIVNSFELKAST